MSENLEGNPLILLSSPQALLEITSFQLALIRWRQEFNNIRISCDLRIHTPEFNIDDVLRESLPLHIPEIINHHIKIVASQLVTWFDFYKSSIFHVYRIGVILKCLNYIVYRSDGKIHYQSTARNILASDRLNLEEKYRIACVHCFKEDIDRLWPLVMDKISISDYSIIAQYDDQYQPAPPSLAVNYWIGVKRNEYIVGPDLLHCNDMHMLAKMEFYWNTVGLPEPRKLLFVTKICSSNKFCDHDVIKFLMSRLDITQQNHLLTLIPWQLVLFLALEEVESCNCSLQVWNHVKNLITNDQFFTILQNLCLAAFGVSAKRSHGAVILREIWITAPKHLRDNILNNHVAVFFDGLRVPCDMRNYGHDMGFYIDVLSNNLNPDLKLKLWTDNWRKFICLAKLSDLDILMKLCLVDEKAVISFKNDSMANFTKLKTEFMLFIKAGLFEELLNYLRFSSDIIRVREIQQQILSLSGNVSFLFHQPKMNFSLNRCIGFNKFINEAFFPVTLADQFKTQFLVDSLEHLKVLLVRGEYLDELRNLTTCFGNSNDINQLKQVAYHTCQNVLKSGLFSYFDDRQWQLFLKWCAPSEEEFLQFKKSLPLDDIFATFLTRVIRGQKQLRLRRLNTNGLISNSEGMCFPGYTAFNNFLGWYFGSDEAVNSFKYSKIRNYKNVEAIKVVFREEKLDIIIDMLKWFFNYDMIQVMTFFSSFIQAKVNLRNW